MRNFQEKNFFGKMAIHFSLAAILGAPKAWLWHTLQYGRIPSWHMDTLKKVKMFLRIFQNSEVDFGALCDMWDFLTFL